MLSLPSAPGFKIFRMRRVQREVDRKPDNFGISDKPYPKQNGHRDHDAQRNDRISDAEHVIKNRPRAQRRQNREGITDRNVRKKISAFAHEEITAARTAFRTIKISAEQF